MASETFADELRAAVTGDKFTLYTELMLQAADLLDHKDEQINTRPAPAATDTGLVTIGFVPPMFVEGKGEGYSDIFRSVRISENHVAVVTRSQAEKLLASEIKRERDLAEKKLSEVVDRMSDDYLALKADNAAKDARIKELEKLCNDTEAEALGYASDKADLEAKLAAAGKALEGIDSIITDSIHENGSDQHRMKIGDKWYVGPPVDALHRILMGLRQVASAALGGKPS